MHVQHQIREELNLDPDADDETVLAAIRALKPAEPVLPSWSFPAAPGLAVF